MTDVFIFFWYVYIIGTRMIIEQRDNINFCFKPGKNFYRKMKQAYGDKYLNRGKIQEWYMWFKIGREDPT